MVAKLRIVVAVLLPSVPSEVNFPKCGSASRTGTGYRGNSCSAFDLSPTVGGNSNWPR